MPTLSLDRVSGPLPNAGAAPLIARPKLTNITPAAGTATVKGVHNHKEYSNRIPRASDVVENDHAVDATTKTMAYITSQELTVQAQGEGSGVSSKTSRESSQGRKEEDGGVRMIQNVEKVQTEQDIQRQYTLEQQQQQRTQQSLQPKHGGAIHTSQQPQRDREDSKQREDPHKKKIQEQQQQQPVTTFDRQKYAEEQCNFPTVTPLVARNHISNAIPQQQQHQQQQPGYSNQQHAARPNTTVPPSEQRPPPNIQNGGHPNYTPAKKLPPPQQQQPSHHRPQITHTHHASEQNASQPVAGGTSVLPGSLNHTSQIQSQSTLFFDRLVSEEVQEFKSYARIIESQSRRLAELESLHHDLEARLEYSTAQRFEMEATLERQEMEWTQKFMTLGKECEEWKKLVQTEKTKNERLLDLVYRKDKEIQRMIQRKYDPSQHDPLSTGPPGHSHNRQGGLPSSQSVHSNGQPISRISFNNMMDVHKSPHEILAANGSPESVRARNVLNALNDFFGL